MKRAEILLERLRGLNSADDTRLQQGKVNRLAGQLKQSQTLLEGYVKTAEKKLGKEHIRKLNDEYIHSYIDSGCEKKYV